MALISGTISNLFSGVSQQAPALRLPTQAEEMDNFYPSLVDGLVKRPALKDIARFGQENWKWKVKLAVINRDADNVFLLVMHGPDMYVYRPNGTKVFEHKQGTASSTYDPHRNKTLTIADHTFILDTKKPVSMRNDTTPALPDGALISIKQVSYDTSYTLEISYKTALGASNSFKTGTLTGKNFSTGDTPPPSISTTRVAQDLVDSMRASTVFTDWFNVELKGSTLYITPKSGVRDYSCTVSDSRGDTHIYAAKNRVQQFAQLPTVAVRDFTVEIVGDEGSAFDNYYVRFIPDDASATFGPGTWVETCAPGAAREIFDDLTLPITLVHTDGRFELKWPAWGKREVGDENSAPDPLFVGSCISDMFLYRNRLGILSDDNLTLSAAGDFFRFYPETVTTIVDSDPISISAGHETVTNLKYAIPFQENLVVFAENAQFNMPSPDVLSPSTAALKISTTFDADLSVKPVTTGQTVAFCVRNGACTGLREFYMDTDTLTRMTGNLTAHVPAYIPGDPLALTCSTTEDVLVVVSKKEPHKMYVYKYYWSGNEKLQAAWFTFSLPKSAEILDAVFHESTLYLAVRRGMTQTLCSMDFSQKHLTDADPAIHQFFGVDTELLCLDRQADLMPGTYKPEQGITVWRPVPPLSADERPCVVDLMTMKQVECTVYAENNYVSAPGDHSKGNYRFGVLYPSTYTFSEQFLRSDDGSGNRIATQLGRLQFRRWSLIYGPSCFFKVRTEQNGTVYEYPFTGEFVNHPRSFLAKPALYKGKFSFPVKSVSDRVKVTITNDTCLPCSIIGAEWEAFYTQRQRGRV